MRGGIALAARRRGRRRARVRGPRAGRVHRRAAREAPRARHGAAELLGPRGRGRLHERDGDGEPWNGQDGAHRARRRDPPRAVPRQALARHVAHARASRRAAPRRDGAEDGEGARLRGAGRRGAR